VSGELYTVHTGADSLCNRGAQISKCFVYGNGMVCVGHVRCHYNTIKWLVLKHSVVLHTLNALMHMLEARLIYIG
jgi:hypothetical protein